MLSTKKKNKIIQEKERKRPRKKARNHDFDQEKKQVLRKK